tara:strand:+ start:454 stop:702 length:249 start_codon:yes stop_codon:yes gene_type:complete
MITEGWHDYTDNEMDQMRRDVAAHHAEMVCSTGEIYDITYHGWDGWRGASEAEVLDYFEDNWNAEDFSVELRPRKGDDDAGN